MAAKLKVDELESVDGSTNLILNNSVTMAANKTLPAASLTGTVPTASLGTGTADSGNFLRGDGSWQTAGSTSASDLTSGTLPMARLSGTLPALDGSALTNISAGKILQVVEAETSTSKSVGNNTFTTTNLSGSITPSATDSRILVMVNQIIQIRTDTTDERDVHVKLTRDTSTTILTNMFVGRGDSGNRHYDNAYFGSKIDSPNTTSSVTYETYFKISGSSADAIAQYDGGTSTLFLMEIGA